MAEIRGYGRLQFSLKRLFQLVFVVAIASSLFATLKWPLALLATMVLNFIAGGYFWLVQKGKSSSLAISTAIFIFLTLFLTECGFSSPHPVTRVAWLPLTLACILEFCAILSWLFSE